MVIFIVFGDRPQLSAFKPGKTLHLRHLSPECRQLLKKAGDLVEANILEDPRYYVASDQFA